jgi:hypothetical protein
MRVHPLCRCLFVACGLGFIAPTAAAQEAPRSVFEEPSQDPSVYRSVESGIEVRLPPGERLDEETLRALGDEDQMAIVTDEAAGTRFELRRILLPSPLPLRASDLPEGGRQPGLLELAADELRRNVGGEILRITTVPLGDADAGLLIARHASGTDQVLRQVAIIPRNAQLAHRLTLVSPAAEGNLETIAKDPAVREAVETFRAVLDSYAAVDQTALYEEQRARLDATRALMVKLRPQGRMQSVCVPEAWWRIRRDGRDIGFARVIEEGANGLPTGLIGAFDDPERDNAADPLTATGVRVGTRMRLLTGDDRDGPFLDRATWSWSSRQLDAGDFRELNRLVEPAEATRHRVERPVAARAEVIGQMRARDVPVGRQYIDDDGITRTTFDVRQQRRLDVKFTLDGRQAQEAVRREPPGWYIPQAVDHLLPRLLATDVGEPIMVATYVPDRRELFNKYLDVAAPTQAELPGGGMARVVVVSSRVGYEGSPTRHYLDADTFRWLGSRNEGTGVTAVPVTREELETIWAGTAVWSDAVVTDAAADVTR